MDSSYLHLQLALARARELQERANAARPTSVGPRVPGRAPAAPRVRRVHWRAIVTRRRRRRMGAA